MNGNADVLDDVVLSPGNRLEKTLVTDFVTIRCDVFPGRDQCLCASEMGKVGHSRRLRRYYLMRKLSLVSLVPFISSRIHTGVMPRPDHFNDLFFLD